MMEAESGIAEDLRIYWYGHDEVLLWASNANAIAGCLATLLTPNITLSLGRGCCPHVLLSCNSC